jgi:Spy/CpxP family protein refolding chaperone
MIRTMRWLLAAAMVLVAVPAFAQGGQPGGRDPQEMQRRQNEILFKDITLTEDQTKRIDSIQTASRDAQRALMQGGGMQDPETRRQMMDLRQKMLNDVRAVLTAEQQTVFDKNRETMASQMPGGRRPPRRE